eukprot:8486975-Pyramimonas_sp.AAC.1
MLVFRPSSAGPSCWSFAPLSAHVLTPSCSGFDTPWADPHMPSLCFLAPVLTPHARASTALNPQAKASTPLSSCVIHSCWGCALLLLTPDAKAAPSCTDPTGVDSTSHALTLLCVCLFFTWHRPHHWWFGPSDVVPSWCAFAPGLLKPHAFLQALT